jgi:exosortase
MTIASDINAKKGALLKAQSHTSLGAARTSPIVGMALIGAVIVATNFATIAYLVDRWSRDPDYSHGFLVPFFSGWLLWKRRGLIVSLAEPVRGRWLGMVLLVSSAVLRLFAVYFEFLLPGAVALIVCVAGVPVLIGGFAALRWAWPAIVFLFFMVPLPGFLAGRLSGPLQHVATLCSTYVLQTIGISAISSGNVIWLSHGQIGVEEACNGLRMLVLFGAVTTAAVFLLPITNWEKVCLLVSSVGIAIAANIFRISITGVALEIVGAELGHKIFHDLAGWIMLPLAMLMLGIEVLLLSKLFPLVPAGPVVVARQSGRTVHSIRSR